MPDANGRFRGISVPELPWQRAPLTKDEQMDVDLDRAQDQDIYGPEDYDLMDGSLRVGYAG